MAALSLVGVWFLTLEALPALLQILLRCHGDEPRHLSRRRTASDRFSLKTSLFLVFAVVPLLWISTGGCSDSQEALRGQIADLQQELGELEAENKALRTGVQPRLDENPPVVTTPYPTPVVVTVAPNPTATPRPQPTATPRPQPTATPRPQPTATPRPQSTPTPKPQPTPTPGSQLTKEPARMQKTYKEMLLPVYRVQPGDTLSGIAVFYEIPIERLMELNGITDRSRLIVDQLLRLPADAVVSKGRKPSQQPAAAPVTPQTVLTADELRLRDNREAWVKAYLEWNALDIQSINSSNAINEQVWVSSKDPIAFLDEFEGMRKAYRDGPYKHVIVENKFPQFQQVRKINDRIKAYVEAELEQQMLYIKHLKESQSASRKSELFERSETLRKQNSTEGLRIVSVALDLLALWAADPRIPTSGCRIVPGSCPIKG